MAQDTPPVFHIEIPAERWKSLPPLPNALVAALEDLFAMRGDTLYYHRDGDWYAVRLERVPPVPPPTSPLHQAVREELLRLLSDPPAELVAALAERIGAAVDRGLAEGLRNLAMTTPPPGRDRDHPGG